MDYQTVDQVAQRLMDAGVMPKHCTKAVITIEAASQVIKMEFTVLIEQKNHEAIADALIGAKEEKDRA